MKLINLDDFRGDVRVSIQGQEYTVSMMTVEQYLKRNPSEELEKLTDDGGRLTFMVKVIAELSNIPEEVLMRQPLNVLNALTSIAQGGDPTPPTEDQDSKK